MRFAILGMLAFTCAAARLTATEYFIDYAGGADVNDGRSTLTPWRHCPGDPAATDLSAQCALAAGDTVIFKGGVTYELTGATGIRLAADGAPGHAIVYDGSGRDAWGTGRAQFTDRHGDASRTAFFADAPRHDLAFRAMEFRDIGGSETLPADPGAPVAPRYGAGIAFLAGATDVTVRDCVFAELGYWFNQRPMSRESVAGSGLVLRLVSRRISVSNCEFARVADGCDFSRATELTEVSVTRCTFRDFIVWPINFPSAASGVATAGVTMVECSHANNGEFDTAAWSGYANGPYVELSIVPAGNSIRYAASATGSPAPSFQWRKNGIAIPGATNATLALNALSLPDAGIYTAVATNTAGSVVSNSVVLVVTPNFGLLSLSASPLEPPPPPSAVPPVFTREPSSVMISAPQTATFTAAATGTPAPTYQWLKDGLPLSGRTSDTLVLSSTSPADSGTYAVAATNSAGTVTSRGATLTVLEVAPPPSPPTAVAPSFVREPQSQSALPGSSAGFTAQATGSPEPTYQWTKNGQPVPGWTNATLVLTSLSTNDSGTYAVIATNSAGSVVSRSATLRVEAAAVSDTVSVSATASRLATTQASVGPQSSRVTFVVQGSVPKEVLVRALGPSLAALGVGGLLADPRLELFREDVRIYENDDWGGDPAVRDACALTGALPLTDPNSKDAAILLRLPPGNYTAVTSGPAGAAGIVLTDVYQFP